jgi:hypothetical protein
MLPRIKLNNIKKISIVLFIILLSALVISQTITTMTAGVITKIPGAINISYPVYLNNNESVVGFQVIINYSTDFLIVKNILATSRLSNATIVFNDEPPILKITVLVNNETDKILPGDGAVLNIIFDVNESAIPENYVINFSDIIISNINTTLLSTESVDSLFEIIESYNIIFLPPISLFENFTLQDGATLPLKFNVTNEDNESINDNSVLVKIYNQSLGIDHTYNASGYGNDFIRMNETEGYYIINIHTGQLNMPEGLYDIEVSFNTAQKEYISFELVDKSQGIGKGRNKN